MCLLNQVKEQVFLHYISIHEDVSVLSISKVWLHGENTFLFVDGTVKNSVLFTGAKVAAGAKVIDSVLMPGAEVAEGAVVTRALVADGIKIGKNAVVGDAASENIELVAKRVKGDE